MKRLAPLAAGLAALGLLAGVGIAAAQQDQSQERARQLEAFEELLTKTVQDWVSDSVNATIDAARRGDADEDGVVDSAAAEPVVVKVGQPLAAHGMYIDGFGVMISIQTPQVSVIPQSLEWAFAQPRVLFRTRDDNTFFPEEESTGVIELRAEMLDRSLNDFIVLLERQPDGLHEVKVEELEGLRLKLEEIRREVSSEDGTRATVEATEATAVAQRELEAARERRDAVEAEVRARTDERRRRVDYYYRDALEKRQGMKETLERNHRLVTDAMHQAALHSLADYGAVLKGLDDDDRVAIVILPPNTWTFARGFGVGMEQNEHVITVRYRDVREHLNGDIDFGRFAERAQIHDRLGAEIKLVSEPAQN